MTTKDYIPIIIALITIIPAWFLYKSQRIKDEIAVRESKQQEELKRAELSDKLIAQAVGLVNPLNQRIGTLEKITKEHEKEIGANKKKIIMLTEGINQLIAQIRKLGHEPVWLPPAEE